MKFCSFFFLKTEIAAVCGARGRGWYRVGEEEKVKVRRVGEGVMPAVWGGRWMLTVWGKRWRCEEAGDNNGGVGGLVIGHVFFLKIV